MLLEHTALSHEEEGEKGRERVLSKSPRENLPEFASSC